MNPDRNKPTPYHERFGTRQPISFRLNDLNNNYYGISGSGSGSVPNASPNATTNTSNPSSLSPRSRDSNINNNNSNNPSTPRRGSTPTRQTSQSRPGSSRFGGSGTGPAASNNDFRDATRGFDFQRHTTRYTYINPAPMSFHRQMARKRYNDRRQQRVRSARVDSNDANQANANAVNPEPSPLILDSNANQTPIPNPFLFSMPREGPSDPEPERLTFQSYMPRGRSRSRGRDRDRDRDENQNHNQSSSSSNRPRARSRSRSRSTTRLLPSAPSFLYTNLPSSAKVMDTSGEKYLPRILSYLTWSEMLVARLVSKKWLEVVSSSPSLQERMGIITVRNENWKEVLALFNESPVIWDSFRILAKIFIAI